MTKLNRIPKWWTRTVILCLVLGVGILIGNSRVLNAWWALARTGAEEILPIDVLSDIGRLPSLYKRPSPRTTPTPDGAERGLTLVTQMRGDKRAEAALVDGSGKLVHQWDLDWFRLWPDSPHLPENVVPKNRPGAHIHGAVMLDDRKVVFNFEYLGLMCVDRAGNKVWKLDYRTHHSVHQAEDGNLWVSGRKMYDDPSEKKGKLNEETVLEIDQNGKVLNEWSLNEILKENNYEELLEIKAPYWDRLHLNDVEPFPASFEEGEFKHGDVMVSFRNANTVLVFNKTTRKITHFWFGNFQRQHDPDFIDGNRISVFDNNFYDGVKNEDSASKIVIVDARDNSIKTVYEGTKQEPFFTRIMGKHQWLPNGNLLITEAMEGRVFEWNPAGKIVWEYRNLLGDNTVGAVEQGERLTNEEKMMKTQKVNNF